MKEKDSDFRASWEEELWGSSSLMERSHIKRDTFLTCWCPHCGKGLNEDDKAVFKIVNKQGDVGISRITPFLNVLDRESSIHVDDDEELADVFCPHCDTSLIVEGQVCKEDACKLIAFLVSVSNSKKLKITLCVRKTCRWYFMSEEDNERLILRDSNEW